WSLPLELGRAPGDRVATLELESRVRDRAVRRSKFFEFVCDEFLRVASRSVEAELSRASRSTSSAARRAPVPFARCRSSRSRAKGPPSATPRAARPERAALEAPSRPRHRAPARGLAEPPARRCACGDRALVPRRACARQIPPLPVLAAVEPRALDRR